jgi:hypothetical protein
MSRLTEDRAIERLITENKDLTDAQIAAASGYPAATIGRVRWAMANKPQAESNLFAVFTTRPDYDPAETRNRLLLVFGAMSLRHQMRQLEAITATNRMVNIGQMQKAQAALRKYADKLWESAPQLATILFDARLAEMSDQDMFWRMANSIEVGFDNLAPFVFYALPPKSDLPLIFEEDQAALAEAQDDEDRAERRRRAEQDALLPAHLRSVA